MRKSWLSRTLALALALVMALGVLTGCGGGNLEDNKTTPAETPEAGTQGGEVTGSEEQTDEQTTESSEVVITYPLEDAVPVTWYVQTGPTLHTDVCATWQESPFHSKLNEKTGVDIAWQFVPIGASGDTDLNLVLTSDKLPTILFGSGIDAEELYDGGQIYDLAPYLPEYAPDYWAYINEHDLIADLESLDGKILTFEFFRAEETLVNRGVIIRQDWLDECGLEHPVTLEDWENVLVTFKDRYGAYLVGTKGKIFNAMQGLCSGTGAMGGVSGLTFYVDADGKVQCAQTQDEWKELVKVLNRWYEMGLIDPDFNASSNKIAQTKALNNETGIMLCNLNFVTTMNQMAKDAGTGAVWVGLADAIPAAGEKVMRRELQNVIGDDHGVISSDSTEEELITALKLLNYGYTEEGAHFWNFGEEGTYFTYDANGNEVLTETVLNDPEGTAVASKIYTGAHAAAPSLELFDAVALRSDPAAMEAAIRWTQNLAEDNYNLPMLKYTLDESDRKADIQTSLETYFDAIALKFVVGEEPLENLDTMVTELYNRGLQDVIDIIQGAYDRYCED